ncbi:VOC family protein [Serinicoccus sp. CNJ-927]|uniref:VOC family protein n=1 Tax=Serinicoccus sp. CNJ-927 TaxID=1904970 RepID=UPI00192D0199|nr:hypothetical protein [Serinicoccus sp. CNJ-927]
MHQLMFVNLPVEDLGRSRSFFTEVGYTFNDDFCDGSALCLELGPTLHAMLLDREHFASFHDSRVAEPGTVETLVCLSARAGRRWTPWSTGPSRPAAPTCGGRITA